MRILFLFLCATLAFAEKYAGPKPPKPDLPYLLHADNLVPTEANEAKEESRKDEVIYTIAGATSTAKTPLAEPIFLFLSDHIPADKLEVYKLESKNGQRGLMMAKKSRRSPPHNYHVSVTKLADNLYKIELDEALENGEYSISPNDSNQVFCFTVY